jgi:hypothetical protein
MDFPAPATRVKALEEAGESAMSPSLAKGTPHGFEVGYSLFSINGRMLGHGDPIRVKAGERVLFHIVNGSATETAVKGAPTEDHVGIRSIIAARNALDMERGASRGVGISSASGPHTHSDPVTKKFCLIIVMTLTFDRE